MPDKPLTLTLEVTPLGAELLREAVRILKTKYLANTALDPNDYTGQLYRYLDGQLGGNRQYRDRLQSLLDKIGPDSPWTQDQPTCTQ